MQRRWKAGLEPVLVAEFGPAGLQRVQLQCSDPERSPCGMATYSFSSSCCSKICRATPHARGQNWLSAEIIATSRFVGLTSSLKRPKEPPSKSSQRFSKSSARFSKSSLRFSKSSARFSKSSLRFSKSSARFSKSSLRFSTLFSLSAGSSFHVFWYKRRPILHYLWLR